MEGFDLDVSVAGDVVVARVSGELDGATGPLLDEGLRAVDVTPETGKPPAEIVVDLGEVTFIDSSGLSALVALHKRFRSLSIPFVVVNLSPQTRRLFEITGMHDVLTVR